MISALTKSADDTRDLAAELANLARGGDVVLLSGDLGAGKTTFAQGFGRALGVTDPITSPTFQLMRDYPARLRLVHVDVYRLDHLQEVVDLGLHELVDDQAVALVEWGDAVVPVMPTDHLLVRIEFGDGDDERRLSLAPAGPAWANRPVTAALERWR